MKKQIAKIKEMIANLKLEQSIRENDKRCAKGFGMTLKQYYKMLREEEKIWEAGNHDNPWDDPIIYS